MGLLFEFVNFLLYLFACLIQLWIMITASCNINETGTKLRWGFECVVLGFTSADVDRVISIISFLINILCRYCGVVFILNLQASRLTSSNQGCLCGPRRLHRTNIGVSAAFSSGGFHRCVRFWSRKQANDRASVPVFWIPKVSSLNWHQQSYRHYLDNR